MIYAAQRVRSDRKTARRTKKKRHTSLTRDYVSADQRDLRAILSGALDLTLCAIAAHAVWLGLTHLA